MKHPLAGCALLALVALAPTRSDADEMSGIGDLRGNERIVHVLNRLGYGPRPGDVETVREQGLYRYIVNQLHPERIQDRACESRLTDLELFRLSAVELGQKFPPPTKEERQRLAAIQREIEALREKKDSESRKKMSALSAELRTLRRRNDRNAPLIELMRAKIIRAVHSERQLEQVMADFWFNHFNVFGRKGPAATLLPEFEEHVLRPHALGKFEDLLGAVARSPAMLFYLDNWMSIAPEGAPIKRKGNRFRKQRRGSRGLNENYARELLELHTVGVDNGYTQKDIVEVARCFTGWTIEGGGYRGKTFKFNPEVHDAGPKKVMGKRIAGGRGVEDGLAVISFLAKHPNTARFISEKLCRRFVSDTPPESLVERCAGTFLESGGDIRLVLYRIFTSPEFFTRDTARAKVKKPHEFVVSSIRALGIKTGVPRQLIQQIAQMGEPLYYCEPPTGFSDLAEKWGGSNAVLSRVNFATSLANGRIRGAKPDYGQLLKGAPIRDVASMVEWLYLTYLGSPPSPSTEKSLLAVVEKAKERFEQGGRGASARDGLGFLTTLILASPDFQMQ